MSANEPIELWDPAEDPPSSPECIEKGKKYQQEGKVRYLGVGDIGVVQGSEEYVVFLQGDLYYCTCPATTTCSHVIALREEIKES